MREPAPAGRRAIACASAEILFDAGTGGLARPLPADVHTPRGMDGMASLRESRRVGRPAPAPARGGPPAARAVRGSAAGPAEKPFGEAALLGAAEGVLATPTRGVSEAVRSASAAGPGTGRRGGAAPSPNRALLAFRRGGASGKEFEMEGGFGMTGVQCRAARALLGWSQEKLGKAAGVCKDVVREYESGRVEPRPASLAVMEAALVHAGVVFLSVPGRGVGVLLDQGASGPPRPAPRSCGARHGERRPVPVAEGQR